MISEHPLYIIIQDICMEIKMEGRFLPETMKKKSHLDIDLNWLYCKHPYIFTKNHQEKKCLKDITVNLLKPNTNIQLSEMLYLNMQ